MLKGRKPPGGRTEVAAANYAFNPVDDDLIIKHRLLTRTTTTRGEPPLKKLQKKFTALVVEAAKDDTDLPDCNRLARAFLQELSTFEIPLLKSRAVVGAHLREKDNYHDLREEVDRVAARDKGDIEAFKGALEESRVERRHKEECEAIRKLVAMQPPRAEMQKSIGELEMEIAGMEAENLAAARLLELRKKQFALLLHVVDELQITIEADQKNLIEEMKMATDEHKNAVEDAMGGLDIMAVD